MGMLRAGFAEADITPPLGADLAGTATVRRRATAVADPLRARAAAFEADGRRVCLVVLDVGIVTADRARLIRERCAAFGYDPAAVMVAATHTHQAPALGAYLLDRDFPPLPAELAFLAGNDPAYEPIAIAGALRAVEAATADLRAASVGFGSGYESRVSFNRRAIGRDGRATMPWHGGADDAGPGWIRYAEGPIDPEVAVLACRDEGGAVRGVLVNFGCHPVCSIATASVSADWPGATAAALRAALGGDATAIAVNGCSGDINPWPFHEPGFTPDPARIGARLAHVAGQVLGGMRFASDALIDHATTTLRLPVRAIADDALADARAYLRAHPLPRVVNERGDLDGEWLSCAMRESLDLLRRRAPEIELEIQALRLGDAALIAIPAEPFAFDGIRIKSASPAAATLISSCTNGLLGYLPTAAAFAHGGHECAEAYYSPTGPGANDAVVAAAAALVRSLWARAAAA